MERVRLATIWFGGCSGCHMSFLDLDEFLIDLARQGRDRLQPDRRHQGVPGERRCLPDRGRGLQRGAPRDGCTRSAQRTKVVVLVRRLRGDRATCPACATRSAWQRCAVLERAYVELRRRSTRAFPNEPGIVPDAAEARDPAARGHAGGPCSCRAARRPPSASRRCSCRCSSGKSPVLGGGATSSSAEAASKP